MRYKNIIIQCKDNKEFSELQKYLFKLSYNWYDYGNRNRLIKKFSNYGILIQTDDRMIKVVDLDDFNGNCEYNILNFAQLIRNEKLKRIKSPAILAKVTLFLRFANLAVDLPKLIALALAPWACLSMK